MVLAVRDKHIQCLRQGLSQAVALLGGDADVDVVKARAIQSELPRTLHVHVAQISYRRRSGICLTTLDRQYCRSLIREGGDGDWLEARRRASS